MKSLATFKRGDTFSLSCTNKKKKVDASGNPVLLGGNPIYEPDAITGDIEIKSQLRSRYNGSLVCSLAFFPAQDQLLDKGKFTLICEADTSCFPLDGLLCDIQISYLGRVRSSETFVIPVVEGITQ